MDSLRIFCFSLTLLKCDRQNSQSETELQTEPRGWVASQSFPPQLVWGNWDSDKNELPRQPLFKIKVQLSKWEVLIAFTKWFRNRQHPSEQTERRSRCRIKGAFPGRRRGQGCHQQRVWLVSGKSPPSRGLEAGSLRPIDQLLLTGSPNVLWAPKGLRFHEDIALAWLPSSLCCVLVPLPRPAVRVGTAPHL